MVAPNSTLSRLVNMATSIRGGIASHLCATACLVALYDDEQRIAAS